MPTKPGFAVLAQVMAVHQPCPPLLGLLRGLIAQDHAPRIIRILPAAHLEHHRLLGAGERLFPAPIAIEPVSTTAFSGGAVAHVFTAHP